MRGPLGAGLGGLPLYWSSFSHSSITEHRSFSASLAYGFSVSAQLSLPCLAALLGPPGC